MTTSPIEAIHPATVNQQGHILASLMYPDAQLYVEQAVIHLNGSLDASRFRQTWKYLLREHTILRTALVWDLGDEPRQVVHRSAELSLEIVEASQWSEAAQNKHIDDVLAQQRRSMQDFSAPPLLRIMLQHRGADEHLLVWTHHHAILDGWSHLQLIRDMLHRYNIQTAPLVNRQEFTAFAASAAAQDRSWHRKFWQARLTGFTAPPPLPRRVLAPNDDLYGSVEFRILPDTLDRARQFASAAGLTLATTVIGCWGLVASRLRPSQEISIGVTTAGRRSASLAHSLGPYATTIPQRIRYQPHWRLDDWLLGIQDDLVAATEFSDCASSEIHTWAGLPPDCPAYDSVVAFSNYPRDLSSSLRDGISDTDAGLTVSAIRPFGGRSQYPLTLVVSESDGLTVRVVNDRTRVRDEQAVAAGEGLTKMLSSLGGHQRSLVWAAMEATQGIAPLETVLTSPPHDPSTREIPSPGTILDIVATSFAAVLGRDSIPVDADFIGLGGHSMLAVALMRQLQSVTGVAITLGDLVYTRTARATAARIGELLGTAEPSESDLTIQAGNPESAVPFPLTALQQAYWVGRQEGFDLGGVDAHIYAEVDIADLDLELLEVVWRRLIIRHAMLRAVVNNDGLQRVLPEVPDYVIKTTDLRTRTDYVEVHDSTRARLSHIRREVSQWPLFTIEAALLPKGQTRLYLSVDMLIGDAQSWRILYREAVALYANPDLQLPALNLQFRDCVAALARLKSGMRYERDREYWQRRLSALPKPPAFPVLRLPPQQFQGTGFERRTTLYSQTETAALRALASAHGATLSTLLLAAFADVIRDYTSGTEFLINVTAYNRPAIHPQINDIVGDFTSLLLLAVSNTAPTFAARLRELQRQIWVDLSHSSYSGIEVLRDLARESGDAAAAAAPVVFTSTVDIGTPDDQQPEIIGEVGYGIGQTPQVCFDYQAYIVNGDLRINWDTISELFPEGYLDQMFAEHRKMIDLLVADHNCVNRARLAVRDPLVFPASQPLGRGQLLQEPFLSQCERSPQSMCISTADLDLTYAEVRRLARHFAGRIVETSPRGRFVPILMEKGWQQPVAVLASLMCGRAFIPLDVSWPTARIAAVLDNAGADMIVTQHHLMENLTPQLAGITLLLPIDEHCSCNDHCGSSDGADRQATDTLAYVIYTSGSTGEPKGVMVTHEAALNTVLDINIRYQVTSTDRIFAVSPLSFDLSIYDIFGAFAAGGTIVIPQQNELRDPSSWIEILRRGPVTVWNSAPALMSLLLETDPAFELALPNLRLCLLSGDWIPLPLPGSLKRRAPNARFVSLGGATEASIWSIAFEVAQVDRSWTSIPYGYALGGQSVYVLDEDLTRQPVGVSGEIYIAGHGLARGYLNRPELTAESFLITPHTGDRLYRTGDVGRMRVDGSIELLGRRDDQVKIGGYRIEPREVEAAITATANVSSAVVLAIGTAEQRRLVAFYTGDANSHEVRAEVARRLPAPMIPSMFHALDVFPLTGTGKLDKQRLASLAADEDTNGQGVPAQANPEHAQDTRPNIEFIIEFITSNLNVAVTPDTNLLDAGLTSIDLIRLCNAIAQRVGVRPDIEALYASPTAAAIGEGLTTLSANSVRDREVGILAPLNSMWIVDEVLDDPAARERFRAQRPRFPRPAEQRLLPEREPLEMALRSRRRSAKSFGDAAVTVAQLGDLLDCLRETQDHGTTRRLYPSAGGLYNVSLYVHVRPSCITGLVSGLYYYHPQEHDLQPVAINFDLDEASLHVSPTNLHLAHSAAFTIFLITDPHDSTPLYGEQAQSLSLLNAGYVGQLLVTRASSTGLGLCPVHGIAAERIRWMFPDGDRIVILHTLLGGSLAEHHLIQAGILEENDN